MNKEVITIDKINEYMGETVTEEELDELENIQHRRTCSLDLLYVRHAIKLIDGYAVIIGPDAEWDLLLVYTKFKPYWYEEGK